MIADVKIYGEKVRAAREGAYLSKGELADKANLNRNTIGRIENADVIDVHPRTIRKIAEALSVDPAFIAPKE